MESTWDLVFAIRTDALNDHIEANKIPLIDKLDFNQSEAKLSCEIPTFKIGWAGNEQYMELCITLKNAVITFNGITECHDTIKSVIHMQYAFKDKETVSFFCKTVAQARGDPSNGALWVEKADVDNKINNFLLKTSFPTILANALIENQEKINFVIANLNSTLFKPVGINIVKSVPAFQQISGINVMAVMCMTHDIPREPSRQFSPELLLEYDYGYILKREVFLKNMILPRISSLLDVKYGNFALSGDDAIVNTSEAILGLINIGGTGYLLRAGMIKLQFTGDSLHFHLNGKTDFTGLMDSYISYSFHAKREPYFRGGNIQKIAFRKLREDEYHSQKYIPAWIEIIASIFTFGIFSIVSEVFAQTIQSRVGNMLNDINFNGNDGGYAVSWANMNLKFTDGGFASNFFMRGRM